MVLKVSVDDKKTYFNIDIKQPIEIVKNKLDDTFLLCFKHEHKQHIVSCKYFRVVGVIE